jgi:hypothetical protein
MLVTSTTRSAVSSFPRRNAFTVASVVDDFALTPAERALFAALQRRGVRFLVVGMAAAVLEGAPVATQDLDLWFERFDEDDVREAAREAGGFWIPGFGMQPPGFGGPALDRIDVVLTAHGLVSFDVEFGRRLDREIDGVHLSVLPLERIIASKRFLMRPKDAAQMPALEATLAAKRAS